MSIEERRRLGAASYADGVSVRLCRSLLGAAVALALFPAVALARWRPPQHLTWYMQFTGRINYGEPVDAYDLDGFDTTAARVRALHAAGKRVICYIDVGTWESWRPDAHAFPRSILGRGDGWPGERWLDIRRLRLLEPIMTRRFGMCRRKGFDAVDPDNINGFRNNTGFPLTAREQLRYDKWVAREVHALGMAVFEKNDLTQARQLEPYFDGVVDEQCNQYHECGLLRPYLQAGKPVMDIEYSLSTSRLCAADDTAGIMGARLNLALNGARFEPCWVQARAAQASAGGRRLRGAAHAQLTAAAPGWRLRQRKRLSWEPLAGRRVGHNRTGLKAPERIKRRPVRARARRPTGDRRGVATARGRCRVVLPGAHAAGRVALAVRLARRLDPQVGVEQRRRAGW